MDFNVLKERVNWGEEFSFYYQGEKYWISQNSEGKYLTKVNGSITQSFKTTDELFQYGTIDGKPIIEVWDEIRDQL